MHNDDETRDREIPTDEHAEGDVVESGTSNDTRVAPSGSPTSTNPPRSMTGETQGLPNDEEELRDETDATHRFRDPGSVEAAAARGEDTGAEQTAQSFGGGHREVPAAPGVREPLSTAGRQRTRESETGVPEEVREGATTIEPNRHVGAGAQTPHPAHGEGTVDTALPGVSTGNTPGTSTGIGTVIPGTGAQPQ